MNIFKKYQAVDVVRKYLKAGVFLFAVTEFIRLGTSRTALELLRETVNFKLQQKLKKKYDYVLNDNYQNDVSKKQSKRIWICWFQGLENAPEIVKTCIESVYKYFKDYEVIIITEDNYRNFVEFPQHIEEKLKNKCITLTHLSDLLRLELLSQYGGIWIDATVLITSEDVPDEILDADLFLFQELKPGNEGHSLPMSSWFIVARPNHPIILATKKMLYEYWKRNNELIDYFLLHHFINISKEHFSELWSKVPKYSSSLPHLLQLEMFDDFSENRYKEICKLTSIHKISYKFSQEDMQRKNTFFYSILYKKNNNSF